VVEFYCNCVSSFGHFILTWHRQWIKHVVYCKCLVLQLQLAKTSQFVLPKPTQLGTTWSSCPWKLDLIHWELSMVNTAQLLNRWLSWHLTRHVSRCWESKMEWLAVVHQNLLVRNPALLEYAFLFNYCTTGLQYVQRPSLRNGYTW